MFLFFHSLSHVLYIYSVLLSIYVHVCVYTYIDVYICTYIHICMYIAEVNNM